MKWNWKEFDPKVGQQDKRSREGCVTKATNFVKNNFNQLGISSFVSVPLVDSNRSIKNFVHVYPPNSPLATFLEDRENRKFLKGLERAHRDTQLWALELWEAKEDPTKFFEILGASVDDDEQDENVEKNDVPKPDKPIFAMSTDENAAYHGKLLRYLYKKEGVVKFKLWSKKDDDGKVIEKATNLAFYDDKAEKILLRDSFFGRGTGGFNIGNKLKVVDAYLLHKMDIDHNKYFEEKPAKYQDVVIDFENPEVESEPNDRQKVAKKGKFQKMRENLSKASKRTISSDDSEDDEPNESTKRPRVDVFTTPVRSSCSRQPPTPSTPARTPSTSANTGRVLKTPLLTLFEREENTPGTPVYMENEDSEDNSENFDEIDNVNVGNVEKAHNGLSTTVYVFDVRYCNEKGAYRGSISDGVKFSTNVFF